MTQPRSPTLLMGGLAILLAACAGGGASPSAPASMGGMESMGAMESMDEHAEFDFGAPADPADADRLVEVTASDEFAFDPAEVDIGAGETITFRITNVGQIVHEFVLGDEDVQQEHEEEMSEGMEMHDEPNAISVEAGETAEIAWTFTEPGEVLYGCHEPGHYDAGMVGTITVSE